MDTFNIFVGLFSVASAIIAIYSFAVSKRANRKSAEVEAKLIQIEQNIQTISVSGGKIQAGGNITAGNGILAHGCTVKNEQ